MITVLFGGSRPEGNTALLTKKALEGQDYKWIDLTEYQFNPIRDVRHNETAIRGYTDDYQTIIDQMLASDIVIFASPIYWYSVSASLKAFIDHWSETLEDPDYGDFKERLARIEFRLILVGGDCPQVKGKPCLKQIEYTLEYLGARLESYIVGTAERPGDILKDRYALEDVDKWKEEFKSLS
ncbi:flavodoxin family protein [Staphylococcus sp. SQ8-PEA]|uniref:FMN-dependent NADPH-azoreductase n=1 Tax=Staphylococcus marylandisciuri TaxID=2981529 RepID=A0ABT2QSA2_9STAP|nr:flavodoxin family protein [Staphylococcus marylandisciuri]MCU5746876.1 flavodoxin family protein [Staphylococcus marylandisciuri]